MYEDRTNLIDTEESILELWAKEKELDPKTLSNSLRSKRKYKNANSISLKPKSM